MGTIKRFCELAAEDRFKDWPLVGEPELGPKIPFFGGTLNYKLQTGNGIEDYTSILRHFGWAVWLRRHRWSSGHPVSVEARCESGKLGTATRGHRET